MQRNTNTKHGFTLVEVIVVLVILAILAAIMIPAMTGWIDRAKEKSLTVACRTCVNAAQTLATEKYGLENKLEAPAPADIIGLAQITGSVTSVALDAKTPAVDTLTYENPAGDAITYYRLPSPHYELGAGGGGASTLSTAEAAQKLKDVVGNGFILQNRSVYSTNDYYGQYAAVWNAMPADVQASLADKVWSLFPNGGSPQLIVYDGTIADFQSAGNSVPVTVYNLATGDVATGKRDTGTSMAADGSKIKGIMNTQYYK